MADWYYTANGKQAGPVDLLTLRGMLEAGHIPRGELVFGPGLTQWMPAEQVPALSTDAATAALQGTMLAVSPSMLGYRGVETDATGLSGTAMNALRGTKPWVRFIAVMMFIGAGLMAVGGMGMLVASSAIRAGRGGMPVWLGGIYLAMAAIYVIPAVLLNRYANGIGALMRTQRTSDVERALGAQQSFWKVSGIMLIVAMCIYAAAIVGVIAFTARF